MKFSSTSTRRKLASLKRRVVRIGRLRDRFHSHIGQDMWVSRVFNKKKRGFFLDFGAFDGITASNTLALERDLKWKGILVEANPTYYPLVCRLRKSISVNAALWPSSRETIEMVDAHGLSSASLYVDHDGPAVGESRRRNTARTIMVDTINPTELLDRFRAPALIEYMSLDVEGAELAVLDNIDFGRYGIALMTVEHSEVPTKKREILSRLEPLGYKALDRAYDYWLYHEQHVAALGGNPDAGAAFRFVEKNYEIKSLEAPPALDD